jgi:hypothetical protein
MPLLQAAEGYLKTQLRLFRTSHNGRHVFNLKSGGALTLADVNKAFHDEFGDSIIVHWNDRAGRCHVWTKPVETPVGWNVVETCVC